VYYKKGRYDEAEALRSGLFVERGYELMGRFLGRSL